MHHESIWSKEHHLIICVIFPCGLLPWNATQIALLSLVLPLPVASLEQGPVTSLHYSMMSAIHNAFKLKGPMYPIVPCRQVIVASSLFKAV